MKEILERCNFLTDIQVWTIEPRVNARLWLENFKPEELPFAKDLLSSFFFFNEKICKNILKDAIQKLSVYTLTEIGEARQKAWNEFLADAIFTTVDIDDANPTASGNQFCRWARDYLGIPQAKFYSKLDALKLLINGKAKNIIFLDDFIGSGEQFTDSWTIPLKIDNKMRAFSDVCASAEINAYYTPLIATEYGIGEILKTCQDIKILPGNTIDSSYSVLDPNSIIWSEQSKKDAIKFLEAVNARAGIKDWKGYRNLGLTIGFAHAVPDATIPLFTWDKNDWKPLI